MMTSESAADGATSVKKSITVRASIDHAFKIFTERLDLWWPKTHKIGKADFADAIVEPKAGGRWFEKGVDGSECDWGRVLVWSPPTKVVLTWQITPTWSYEPDPSQASKVEVTFHDLGDGKVRVDLVHSELDRHGNGWQELREAVASGGGWSGILEGFAKAAVQS